MSSLSSSAQTTPRPFVLSEVEGHAAGAAFVTHASTSLGTNGGGGHTVTPSTHIIPGLIRDPAVRERFQPQFSRNRGSRINSGMMEVVSEIGANPLRKLDNPWFLRTMKARAISLPIGAYRAVGEKPRPRLNFLNIRFLQSSPITARKGL